MTNQANCSFGLRAGGWDRFQFSATAMGLRQVSDLSEYSVSELLQLIQLATKLLKQKLSLEPQVRHSAWSDTDSGISVVEFDAPSAGQGHQRSYTQAPVQSGSSSSAARLQEPAHPAESLDV